MLIKIETSTSCKKGVDIRLLNTQNLPATEIELQISEVYIEQLMSHSMVWKWVWEFIERCNSLFAKEGSKNKVSISGNN